MENLQPKLRFPEFKEEWGKLKVADYFDICMCKRIFANQTTANGEIPFYKIGTLGNKPDAYISRELFNEYKSKYKFPNKRDVLITCSGTVGKTVVFDGNDSYYQDSNIVWLKNDEKKISNQFLYRLLNNINWSKLNSTTITRIYSSDLKNLIFNYPTLQEQTKIADFLGAVDKQLDILNQKKEKLNLYKKGVMQQLFAQQLRFKDDNGNNYPDWEEKCFDEIFESVPTKKHQIKSSEYLNEGVYPIVDQGQKFIVGFSNEKEKVFKTKGSIIFGDHTTILKYIDFNFIIGADGVKVLQSKTLSDIKFLYYNLSFNNVKSEGYKRHYSILKELKLHITSIEEQTKIANFLSAIDKQIEAVENQITKTETYKKGLLQQMFV